MIEIEKYKSVLDLAYALRRVQRVHGLSVIAATQVLDGGDTITLRFTGATTPVCEIVNADGVSYMFEFSDAA